MCHTVFSFSHWTEGHSQYHFPLAQQRLLSYEPFPDDWYLDHNCGLPSWVLL